MNKLEKFLKKLSASEKVRAKHVIDKLIAGDLSGMDIKLLTGRQFIFRVRVGRLRIIFSQRFGKTIILDASYRSEKTYRNI